MINDLQDVDIELANASGRNKNNLDDSLMSGLEKAVNDMM